MKLVKVIHFSDSLALTKTKDDFYRHKDSSRLYTIRKAEGKCTVELNFTEGMTRMCFNLTAISNKDLVRHSQIMTTEDSWKKYLQNLEEQDRRDLFSILAIMQGDFHMYRGKSPSHLPPFLYKTKGKCRVILNFKDGLTEISFNSKTIRNKEIDEFLKCFEGLN